MLVLFQTSDVALHGVVQGKGFEKLKIILGRDMTGGALARAAQLSAEVRTAGKVEKGCRWTSLAHQWWTQSGQKECPHGWTMCGAMKKLLQLQEPSGNKNEVERKRA